MSFLEPYYTQSMGTLISHAFFMREDSRKNNDKSVDKIIEFMKGYNVAFKDVNGDMLFKAELHHYRYYRIHDFDTLCIKCFNFTNIKQQAPEIDMETYRPLNNIKSLTPAWSRGIGTMTSLSELWQHRRK